MNDRNKRLQRLGFRFESGSVHTKRTMMVKELTTLFRYAPDSKTPPEGYDRLVIEQNCLGKKTGSNRRYTATYLRTLYGLDPELLLFRALRYFWDRDAEAGGLLALLCSYSRDELLRVGYDYIASLDYGVTPDKKAYEAAIDRRFEGRFGEKMLHSLIRNLLSSWTQSGHLTGHVSKVRSRPVVTPGAAAYAMFIGYCAGARGPALLQTDYARLLECPRDELVSLLEQASKRGFLSFKRLGQVIEVSFPDLLSPEDLECINEQA